MMKRFVCLAVTLGGLIVSQATAEVFMANGIKIGEVDANSAMVWTRLTRSAEMKGDGNEFPKDEKLGDSRSYDLSEMNGWVPGSPGEVRVTCWPAKGAETKISTGWQAVSDATDFTHQFRLAGLQSGVRHELLVEGRVIGATEMSCRREGSFMTAPASDQSVPVKFTVVTGQDYVRRDHPLGHQIYSVMHLKGPDFFVHTGDIEYYDKAGPYADTLELARFKWNRIYAAPHLRGFHNQTSSYFIKDDHDTLKNDCWPGQSYGELTWQQGLDLFREQVPMGEKTYRTIRWGKDLQIWLVEGRDFRSPNNMPDGPDKTIWGAEQKQWFFDTVKQSDATFRVLISPTPVVGPDRGAKNDNHANKGFTHEGDELRAFMAAQKNFFVICGDRHWQYVSKDPKTGLIEYSCGPTTDVHAGGFNQKNKSSVHQYLKVKGGFLMGEVKRDGGEVSAVLTHHGVTGEVYHRSVLVAE